MLDKCTNLCRIIFLLSIVILAVYFIYTNEKKSTKEHFETEDDYVRNINKVFNTLLNRPATSEEIVRYKKMMQSSNDTKEIVEALSDSAEYRSMVNKGDNKVSLMINDTKTIEVDYSKKIDTYRSIMEVYESTLNRLPNLRELNYYTYSLLTDKSFTVQKLKIVLEASKEYDILKKNQSNNVHAELPGNVTNLQMTYIVQNAYIDVFDEQPTQEMEEFLKQKLAGYKMDEEKLKSLLLLMKAIDSEEMMITENKQNSVITIKTSPSDVEKVNTAIQEIVRQSTTTTKTVTQETFNELTTKSSSTKESNSKDSASSQKTGDVSNKSTSNQKQTSVSSTNNENTNTVQNIFNIINPKPEELDKLLKTIQANGGGSIIGNAAQNASGGYFSGNTCSSEYTSKRFIDEFYDNIDNVKPPRRACGGSSGNTKKSFNKNEIENTLFARDRNMLAEYTSKRNMDDLKMSCARNTYALQNDDKIESKKKKNDVNSSKDNDNIKPTNYFVDTKPTLGTFLEEANNTSVGSIMPKFIYKEYQ